MTMDDDLGRTLQVLPEPGGDAHAQAQARIDRFVEVLKKWEGSAQQLLCALSDEDLTRVVLSARSDFVTWVMDALGLGQRWKHLSKSKLKKQDAFTPLIGKFREQLAARGHRGHPIGISLLFYWWGRHAESEFVGPLVQDLFGSKQIQERVGYFGDWLRSEAQEAKGAQHALLERRGAPKVLDRIFAGLPIAIQDVSLEGFDVAVKEWLEFARAQQAEKERAQRVEPTKSPPAAALPPTGAPVAQEQAKPVSHDQVPAAPMAPEVLKAPAFLPPMAPEPLLPEVATIRELLRQLHEEVRVVDALMKRGQYELMAERGLGLAKLRNGITEAVRSVQARLEAQALEAPKTLPDNAYSEPQVADAYLVRLSELLREAEILEHRKLQEGKASLLAEFEQLGLRPPERLETLTTLRELQMQQEELRPRLKEERALQRLLFPSEELARQARESLLPSRRLEFYTRWFSEGYPARRMKLLDVVARDPVALAHEPATGRRLLADGILALLEREVSLPPGTWRLFARLCQSGAMAECLTERDLADYLTVVPVAHIHTEELYEVLGSERAGLPSELCRILDGIEVARLPAAERIPRLAALALDGQLDTSSLLALLTALVESERHADAVLLSLLATHATRHLPPAATHEPLLVFLVELAGRDPVTNELIGRTFLQDASWLHERPDDVAVLLYLSARTGNQGPVDNLQDLKPGLLHEAELSRPALVGQWLMTELLAQSPVDYTERQRVLILARQALKDWDHDLLRESRYRNWEHAKSYQSLFNARLGTMFQALEERRPLPELNPLEFIKETGRVNRLPEAKHPGLGPMVNYLTDQLERLRLIERAVTYLRDAPLREALDRCMPDLRAALEQEHRDSPGTRAVQRIYQRALERV